MAAYSKLEFVSINMGGKRTFGPEKSRCKYSCVRKISLTQSSLEPRRVSIDIDESKATGEMGRNRFVIKIVFPKQFDSSAGSIDIDAPKPTGKRAHVLIVKKVKNDLSPQCIMDMLRLFLLLFQLVMIMMIFQHCGCDNNCFRFNTTANDSCSYQFPDLSIP